ncbi:hypothetical protein [Prevotella sp. 10(H)]|uniref:hypothetical protein n=1 Tax=Prevotella sp. 10(H) TaxID=1158294 RepID=UPI0004A778E1|nr:hypothetical protein [Prevotella sp. 10(H)]
MERTKFVGVWGRVSWGSVIAGVITVIAISILLSILGSSVGLFMFDPTSGDPVSGIGTTMGIWTVVSLLLSLAAGGFVAGKLSGSDGMIHGFLVWASTLIIGIIFVVMIAASAVRLTTNILGSVTSAAGSILSGAGSMVGSGVSGLADEVQNVFGDIEFDAGDENTNVRQDIRTALRKSGVKEFQPEYLQNQMKGVKTDFDRSVKRLATHPNDAESIINSFLDKVKKRGETYAQNINRDDLNKAIANNSNLSKAEVDKAVDEYIELIDKAKTQGQEQIQNLEQSIDQAKRDLEAFKQKALEEADKATNAAAWSGIISFISMLIGAVLCIYMGFFGTRKTRQGYEA